MRAQRNHNRILVILRTVRDQQLRRHSLGEDYSYSRYIFESEEN